MTMRDFHVTTPLRPGITLVEASAGTGKTWSISNLVIRLIAEQKLGIEQILVVTYTNAATAELRDRIRGRLAEAVAVLEAGDPALAKDNDALRGLLDATPEERLARGLALRAALAAFDEAAISTIHGFCQRMLQMHAFESRAGFDVELVPDIAPVLEQIVDDALARTLHDIDAVTCAFLTEECGMNRDGLRKLAARIAAHPDAPVEPAGDVDLPAWWRAVTAFRQQWQGGGRDDLARVLAATAFRDARIYKAANTQAALAWIDAWLAGDALPPLDDIASRAAGKLAKSHAVQYLHPHGLEAYGGDAAILGHAIIKAWARLQDMGRDLADQPRVAFAARVRDRLSQRLGERWQQSFDDLLRTLSISLRDPEHGAALATAIRARFQVALIDEFQDTDPLQWQIFASVFGTAQRQLYLIGDPKQAIYGFRGADVFVYLQAVREAPAERRFTMRVNQRSDRRLVSALGTLYLERPEIFHHPDIAFVDVQAAERHQADGLRWPDRREAPLQIRSFDASLVHGQGAGVLTKTRAWAAVPARAAADIVEFLSGGAEIRDEHAPGGWRAVRPGDIAVLVRKNRQAMAVRQALLDRGVQAVVANTGSVFATEEALGLQRFLESMTEPNREGPARALAVDPLFGRDAGWLASATAGEATPWSAWIDQLVAWSRWLNDHGFTSTWRRVLQTTDDAAPGLEQRLLTRPDGERRLTNLRHLTELLHVEAVANRHGAAGLLVWLRAQRQDGARDPDAAQMRLESDADAVQIVTLHKSKGLQYPIVWLPYLWDGRLLSAGDERDLRVHDPDGALRLDLRMAKGDPIKAMHIEAARDEARQENLRLLYVALTRARHRCVLYTGRVAEAGDGPVGFLLHGNGQGDMPADAPTRLANAAQALGKDGDPNADLRLLAAASIDPEDGVANIAWSACTPAPRKLWQRPAMTLEPLVSREFPAEGLDRLWRRYSYSSLTRGKDGAVTAQDLDLASRDVDAEEDTVSGTPSVAGDMPLRAFPGGADAGDLLHKILEKLDFSTLGDEPDLAPLQAILDEVLPRHGHIAPVWRGDLIRGLQAALATPLGPKVDDLRLCDVELSERLTELRFDLPLAGGEAWRPGLPAVTSPDFAAAFLHRTGDERMTAAYIDSLQEESFGTLAGFLNGSIDLVFRAKGRWFLADYKSNRLDPDGRGLQQRNYGPRGVRKAMEHSHYYLQYHLYLVALHRFLRLRLRGYDYERDVGGAYYLFVRGMVGPDTPVQESQRNGVFFDKPPLEVIDALDRLFTAPGDDRRAHVPEAA